MSILLLLHYFILFLVLFLPFMPYRFFRYLYFTPILIPSIWVLTGDCPLSIVHRKKGDQESFTKSIYKKFNKNITEQDTSHFNTFLLVFIMVLIATRFKYRIKCK